MRCTFTVTNLHGRINSTKSPASSTGKENEPRLTSQVRRVREVVCALISVFLLSERWRFQYWSAYVAAAVMWLRRAVRLVGLALNVVMHNDRDSVDIIPLYFADKLSVSPVLLFLCPLACMLHVTSPLNSSQNSDPTKIIKWLAVL